jgi:hypothetical protein
VSIRTRPEVEATELSTEGARACENIRMRGREVGEGTRTGGEPNARTLTVEEGAEGSAFETGGGEPGPGPVRGFLEGDGAGDLGGSGASVLTGLENQVGSFLGGGGSRIATRGRTKSSRTTSTPASS